ncbi:hypothetical protein [Natrarchaeobius chitinivorans]|nr:hypothetical protein [Natrarchaeobius chitinivorans]
MSLTTDDFAELWVCARRRGSLGDVLEGLAGDVDAGSVTALRDVRERICD